LQDQAIFILLIQLNCCVAEERKECKMILETVYDFMTEKWAVIFTWVCARNTKKKGMEYAWSKKYLT
jgi:hypothetical protein